MQSNDSLSRKPFKFTITTDIDKEADDEEVKIIISINKLDGKQTILYDLDCECDGVYEFTGLSDDHECIYKPNTGTHQISVRGEIPGLYLCARHTVSYEDCTEDEDFRCDLSSGEDDSSVALKSIDSWGDISWKRWNVSNVTDMRWMFSRTVTFNQPLEKWNVSNVTNMSEMFREGPNHLISRWRNGMCRMFVI